MSVVHTHPYMKTQRLGSVVDDASRAFGDAFQGPLIPSVGMSGMVKMIVVGVPLFWLLGKLVRATKGEHFGGAK